MGEYSEKVLSIITKNNDEIHKIIDKYSYGLQNEMQNYCDDANSMLHKLFLKLGYKTDNEDTQSIIEFINEKVNEKTNPF
jgi:DNA-directed RNA polymerase subunit F